MDSKGTVFIVDDNDDFRTSIAWLLRGEGYRTIEFGFPEKAINALKLTEIEALRRYCILLDVRMPLMNGFKFHELLQAENIKLPVIYMTGHGDVAIAVEAMKKGAITLLEKPLKPEQLLTAIQSALEELEQADQLKARKSVDTVVDVSIEQQNEFLQLIETISPREEQVLKRLVNGKANKVIAYELGISVRTVEVHRARIMKKLDVRSVSELIKMVMICQVSY